MAKKNSPENQSPTDIQLSKENQLPAKLQDDYEIVGNWPDKFEMTGLEVTFIKWDTMTPQFADHLISEGFPGIRKKTT